ncbi:MAG: hypothetical protein ACLQFI_05580 [Methylocella sp.]
MGEGLFVHVPKLAGPMHLCENVRINGPLIGGGKQRHGARLIVDAEARAATFVLRHFGEQRPRAEHQPAAGNLHARMGAAGARLPFSQKLLPWLHPKLHASSGRIEWRG